MKKLFAFLIIIFCSFSSIKAQNNFSFYNKPFVTGGISVGYTEGFGLQGNLMISNFAQDFPLSARLAMGYTSFDPGNAWAARKIFINDATTGVPQKNGTDWNFRMDLLYQVHFLSLKRFYIFGGPRYSTFSGEFDFIDGNEFFKITSNQWGVGLGAESYFAIVQSLDLALSTGFDYYLDSTIEGHDTAYNPDGTSVNSRNGYTYSNADQAINQPKIMLRVLLGFNYHF
ncbi:MAG: hypothetical protein WB779_06340 [Ignavibacteriaceae bacterium]|jgi:hypothetical protein